MPTKNILGTAFKGLAIIGLGYAAKRLLSDKELRGKVMDRFKSAMSTVRGKADSATTTRWSATAKELARNDEEISVSSTDDVMPSERDTTFPSFPPPPPKGFNY